jgi:hypothetical protein
MLVFVSYFVILLKFVVVIIRIISPLKLLEFSWISPKFVVSIPLGGKGGELWCLMLLSTIFQLYRYG